TFIVERPQRLLQEFARARLVVTRRWSVDGGQRRLRHWRRPHQAAPAAATAPMPTPAAVTAVRDGVGRRARSDTGWSNVSDGQPRCTPSRRNARSGFTTVGWPTASSSGMSLIESL